MTPTEITDFLQFTIDKYAFELHEMSRSGVWPRNPAYWNDWDEYHLNKLKSTLIWTIDPKDRYDYFTNGYFCYTFKSPLGDVIKFYNSSKDEELLILAFTFL